MKFFIYCTKISYKSDLYYKNLKKNNHKVFLIVYIKEKLKIILLLKPFLKQNLLSKLIEIIFKPKNKHILFFPKFSDCFKKYKKLKPDVAFIRLYGRINTYILAIILKILKTKIIFYEQAPNDLSHLKKKN